MATLPFGGKLEYRHHTKIKTESCVKLYQHPLKATIGVLTMHMNKKTRHELPNLP